MNHLDFLNTATRLITTESPTEADIRSAVSRSYYAVYHHVLLWWKSHAQFPDYRDRGHAKIQRALFNAGIPAAKRFSLDIEALNADRRDADYELDLNFAPENGHSILERARNSVAAFDALDKSTLADGIKNYLRRTNQI
jgi:hypothetical protein